MKSARSVGVILPAFGLIILESGGAIPVVIRGEMMPEKPERWWVEVELSYSNSMFDGGWLPVLGGDEDRTLEEAIAYYQWCEFPKPNSSTIYRFRNVDTGETVTAVLVEIM